MTDNIKTYLEACLKLQRSQVSDDEITKKSPQAFVLRHGRPFKYGRTKLGGPIKQCFSNAAHMALRNRYLTYCEGYVQCVIPIEHAWCIDKKGRVIETTMRDQKHVEDYFGVPIKTEFLRRQMRKDQHYGVFGWMSNEWRNATPEEIVDMEKSNVT